MSYFTTTPPHRWAVHSFLSAAYEESKQTKTQFLYDRALDSYRKLLGDIKSQTNPEHRTVAALLLDRFNEKGRASDQARARQWAQAHGFTVCKPAGKASLKRGAQKTKERPTKRREPRVIIGTYVEGNISGSTFNQNPEPVPSGGSLPPRNVIPEAGESVCDGPQSVCDNPLRTPEEPDPDADEPAGSNANFHAQKARDFTPDSENEIEEIVVTPRFREVLQRSYDDMQLPKLPLSNGEYLEDIYYQYARGLDAINLAHWSIVDPDDKAVLALFPGHRWPAELQSEVPAFPQFPKILDEHIKKYVNVTDRATARELAFTTDAEWSTSEKDSTGRPQNDPETLYIKYWIDGCFEHVLSLTTESSDLLKETLYEGSWEAIYYKLLDNAYYNLPSVLLQRKEIALLAHKHDPNPVFPYTVCYDGVVHTRAHKSPSKSRLEFAVVEVKREFDPAKWQEDLTKLYAGCRAILAALKRSVDGHEPTMKKVIAAGVLQAGPYTLVMMMTCLGLNMYYVKRGTAWKFPETVADVTGFGDLLVSLWKVREVARRSYEAVKYYHDSIKGGEVVVDRTGADFF